MHLGEPRNLWGFVVVLQRIIIIIIMTIMGTAKIQAEVLQRGGI